MSKENSMCWFPFYANDFLGSMDVQLMSLEQVGAYALLLSWQWNSDSCDCKLPNDIEKVSRLARMDMSLPENDIVAKKFRQDDGWYNAKLKKVFYKQLAQYEKMSKGGRKGGLKGGTKQPEPEPEPSPKGKKRLTETQKKRVKVSEITPTMKLIGSWFGRKPSTKWSVYEAEALEVVSPTDEELEVMGKYYTATILNDDFRRRNVETLLNNWTGEMDRATKRNKGNKPRITF